MSEERHIQLELPFDDIAMESGEKPVKAMSSVARKKTDAPANTRMRAKRRRIRVTFDDGTTICDTSATATMIMTIEKIGVERVASLNMENCHVPLVSRQVVDRYAEWTKQMADGWYLMAQSDTKQKYMQLKSIMPYEIVLMVPYLTTLIGLGVYYYAQKKRKERLSGK